MLDDFGLKCLFLVTFCIVLTYELIDDGSVLMGILCFQKMMMII